MERKNVGPKVGQPGLMSETGRRGGMVTSGLEWSGPRLQVTGCLARRELLLSSDI